ncbi:MAG: radical SAM protein [Bryobacteraceae bacterium]|jgi:radical SAM superfamily enzyme YgiQ (UPF0313 family)
MPLSKRILLIEPPFCRLFGAGYALPRYPLALGYLAGTVQSETNWDVMAYNADFLPNYQPATAQYLAGPGYEQYLANLRSPSGPVWQEVRATIADYRPDIVGISSKTQNFASAKLVAHAAKDVDRRIIVLLGGPHVSMVGAEVLQCPDIDVAVRGEGERTIVELLQVIANSGSLNAVDGIIFRSNGIVAQTRPRKLISDLDSLCFPHQSAPTVLKDYKSYPRSAFQSIFAARGCPFNCAFCGSRYLWTRFVRRRSVPSVVREIQLLREAGITSAHFADDTFGVSKPYIHALCSALRKDCRGLEWSCELHVNLVDNEVMHAMKSSGCMAVHVGIESGNNEILKAIRKGFTIEKALAATETVKKHGLALHTFFMVGFPQETERSIRDTVTAIKACNPYCVYYSIFTPYPGTEAFDTCRAMGLIPDNFDISLYNHQSPANHFCAHIEPLRFRELAGEVERLVAHLNRRNAILRKFAPRNVSRTVKKIVELGPRESFRRAVSVLKH